MRHAEYSFTFTGLSQEAVYQINGMLGCRINIEGTFVAQAEVQGRIDQGAWHTLDRYVGNAFNTSPPNSVMTAPGTNLVFGIGGFTEIRIRCSSYTSGTMIGQVSLTEAPLGTITFSQGRPYVQMTATTGSTVGTLSMDNYVFQESIALLGAGITATGTPRDTGAAAGTDVQFGRFMAFASASQAGNLYIGCSMDNVTWYRASADVAVGAGGTGQIIMPLAARWHRAVFVNGGVAQTSFLLSSAYLGA